MTISFGQPGLPKKTFGDAHFDFVGGQVTRKACKLNQAMSDAQVAAAVIDGQFLSPTGDGHWDVAPDASRSIAMVFTAHTENVVKIISTSSTFVGEDRTDTPTGLIGDFNGYWPSVLLATGAIGTAIVGLSDYVANAPLTVRAGKLSLANVGGLTGERVIGYVEEPSTVVGSSSISAKLSI